MATKRKHGDTEKEKVVLAYSGGLDTSVILVWLVEKVEWLVLGLQLFSEIAWQHFLCVLCGLVLF